MKQLTLAAVGFERYAKTTGRAAFLAEMERVVPWSALCALIEPSEARQDQMVGAIREFGFRIPIVAESDGSVVDGHLRLKAARKLGLTEVPVALADELASSVPRTVTVRWRLSGIAVSQFFVQRTAKGIESHRDDSLQNGQTDSMPLDAFCWFSACDERFTPRF
jgi:hypothetical protein